MAECVKVRWSLFLFVVIPAAISSCICFIELLIDVVRKGPLRVLYVRRRDIRPEVLSNSAFGSHGFVRLKVSNWIVAAHMQTSF